MRYASPRNRSAIAGILACLFIPNPACAEGAFAVGSTGDVVKHGIAYGGSYNHRSRRSAEEGALRACREYRSAPQAAEQCKIVATFTNECYAVANDPKPGTPGTGWAIARNEETAKERAMAACRASAGRGREKFCVIELTNCDQ